MTRHQFLCLVIVVISQAKGWAGGPTQISQGSAVLWNNSNPISYKIDKGPLGTIPELKAQAIVEQAFTTWALVPTARLKFTAGLLDEDVKTATRYLIVATDTSRGSLVILDNVGDIVKGIYGEGQEENILGFASPRLSGAHVSRFVALMNGFLTTNQATVRSTMVHEFGHALGLDHTQINSKLARNADPKDDQYIPTMFPTSADDDSTLVDLNPDDAAWVSRLYPSDDYAKTYGIIRGRLLRKDQTAVLGANIVASALIDKKEDPLLRYSCVSDYLLTSDGSFEIVVKPGTYTLMAEPILIEFVGGSSVGPHAMTATGASFKNRIKEIKFAGQFSVTAGQVTDVGTLVTQ